MSQSYLQNIIDDISFENLPVKWQGFNFAQFSKDKTLFDFQKQGLQNALKGLWLYFKDKEGEKQSLYNHYLANDFEEKFVTKRYILDFVLVRKKNQYQRFGV